MKREIALRISVVFTIIILYSNSMTVMIDTYQTIKTLTADEAFSEIQAERILDVLKDSGEMLATKADIQALDMKLDGFRNELKSEIENLQGALKSDIGSVRSEIDMLRTDMIAKIEISQRDLTIRAVYDFCDYDRNHAGGDKVPLRVIVGSWLLYTRTPKLKKSVRCL